MARKSLNRIEFGQFHMPLHVAEALIAENKARWQTIGVSLRELTYFERQAIDNPPETSIEILPPKEIHGIVERMPKSEVFTPAIRYELLGQARELCEAR